MLKTNCHKTAILLAALCLAVISVMGTALAGDISVTVKAASEVSGEEVRLRDMAVINGPEDALKNDLADIFITKAAKPGQSVTIRRSYLEHRLTSSGLPLESIDFTLPEQTVVTRRANTLNEGWVRTVVLEYLNRTEPYKSGEWELVSLRTGTLPALAVGELTYHVIPQNSANPAYLNLAVYLNVDGAEAGRIMVNGRLDIYVRAVVAARRLERGDKLQAGDLSLTRLSLSRVRSGALTDPGQAEGLTCRHRIQAGQPVMAKDLEKPMAVSRGDMVTIVAKTGSLLVTTSGQAKQDGALGDNISVLNLNSKKMVLAEVVGPSKVRVVF